MPSKSKASTASKTRKSSGSSIGSLRFSGNGNNNSSNRAGSPNQMMSSFTVPQTHPKGPPNFPPPPFPPGLGKLVNGRWVPVAAPRPSKASTREKPTPPPRPSKASTREKPTPLPRRRKSSTSRIKN